MPRLNNEARSQMIKSAKDVFFCYQTMNMLKNYSTGNTTVAKQLEAQVTNVDEDIPDEGRRININLGNGLTTTAVISRELGVDNGFVITFDAQPGNNPEVKDLASYKGTDLKQMLSGKTWKMTKDVKNEWQFSTELQSHNGVAYDIGGPGKIDLYSLHIANLKKFIDHLNSKSKWYQFFSNDPHDENAEIAMTTGSGKSFTLALQALVEGLAGVQGIITVPNETLQQQLLRDFERLLPLNFIQQHIGNKDNIVGAGTEANFTKDIIIGTTGDLLANPEKFQALKAAAQNTNGKVVLQHDEAHKLNQNELTFKAAKQLAKNFINIYSTATKTKAVTKIGQESGNQAHTIASMTKEEKTKQGYAIPAAEHDISVQSRAKIDKATGRTGSWKEWLYVKVAELVDVKTPDNIKPAYLRSFYIVNQKDNYKVGQDIPGHTSEEKISNLVRHNIIESWCEKSITYVGTFPDAVNVSEVNKKMAQTNQDQTIRSFFDPEAEVNTQDVRPLVERRGNDTLEEQGFYHNKNRFRMRDVYLFATMGSEHNPEAESYVRYQEHITTQYKKDLKVQITQLVKMHGMDVTNPGIVAHIDKLVQERAKGLNHAPIVTTMHNTLDLALTVIAGLGQSNRLDEVMNQYDRANYLDKRRFEDLTGLTNELSAKAGDLNQEGTRAQIKQLLTYNKDTNPLGIDENSAQELSAIIFDTIKVMASDGINKEILVNNWHGDLEVFKQYGLGTLIAGGELDTGSRRMVNFAKANFQQLWFNSLEQNEGIKNEEVFSGFTSTPHTPIWEQDYKKKVRAQRPVEALNPFYQEEEQRPTRTGYTVEIARNKLKLGLAASNISNDPSIMTGFNDQNLQQIVAIISNKHDPLLDPATKTQFEGRLRGKNSQVMPNCVRILGSDIELYANEKEYKEASIEKTGRDLGIQLMEYIKTNSSLTKALGDDELSETVINKLYDTFNNLGKQEGFDFGATEKDFIKAVNHAMHYMHSQQNEIQKGTELGLFIRVVGTLLYLVASVFRYFESKEYLHKVHNKIEEAARNLGDVRANLGENPDIMVVAELTRMEKDIAIAKIYQKCLEETSFMDVLVNDSKQKGYNASLMDVLAQARKEGALNPHTTMNRVIEKDPMILFGPADNPNRTQLNQYPQVVAVIKGVISLNALNGNKVDLINQAGNPQALITSITNNAKQGNFRHDTRHLPLAERRQHLDNIRDLLVMLTPQLADRYPVMSTAENPDLAYETFAHSLGGPEFAQLGPKITIKMLNNAGAAQYLQPNQEALQTIVSAEIKAEVVDIMKRAGHPFIANDEYIKSLYYPLKFFNNAELKLILGEEAAVQELRKYAEDLKALKQGTLTKDQFYNEYCKIDMADNAQQLDLRALKLMRVMENAVKVSSVIHDANKEFYSIQDFGAAGDERNPLWRNANGITATVYQENIPDSGQVWKVVSMLKKLKEMLPAINDIQYCQREPELNKSREVCEKILQQVIKNRRGREDDSLTLTANTFIQALQEERNKGKDLSYEQLQQYPDGSRAEQMRRRAQQIKEEIGRA